MPIARARFARFTCAIPRSASTASHLLVEKIRLSKSHHGPKLWASQNIFAGPTTFGFWPNMAIPSAKPYVEAQAPAWQASPWGHSPSPLAPCAVPMRLSRIGQHIKDESCAKQRALLGVFSSRFSSVSRGIRSAFPIFSSLPLVVVLRMQFDSFESCSPIR